MADWKPCAVCTDPMDCGSWAICLAVNQSHAKEPPPIYEDFATMELRVMTSMLLDEKVVERAAEIIKILHMAGQGLDLTAIKLGKQPTSHELSIARHFAQAFILASRTTASTMECAKQMRDT